MTTRLTTRELVRSEMQELFHEGFNLLHALEANLMALRDAPATATTLLPETQRIANRLIAIQELLRARILSTIG